MDIAESFANCFTAEVVTEPEQLERIFKMRYDVYCNEFEFLDANIYPNGLESDDADDYSMHFLITHRASGIPAGCVRIVPSCTEKPDLLMPFEEYAIEHVEPEFQEIIKNKRETLCELSRFAVDARFRRRRGEGGSRFGIIPQPSFSTTERRLLPLISITSFLASTVVAEEMNREIAFAVMEPFLTRFFSLVGARFQRISPNFEHSGTRAVYVFELKTIRRDIKDRVKGLYQYVQEEVRKSMP